MKNMRCTKRKNNKVMEVVLSILLLVIFLVALDNLITYPEKYFSTWRYQLKLKIDSGDEQAINYYKTNYTERGIYLYGEYTDK